MHTQSISARSKHRQVRRRKISPFCDVGTWRLLAQKEQRNTKKGVKQRQCKQKMRKFACEIPIEIRKFAHMTIEEAQQAVDQWIKTYGVRYFSELTNMAVLTEEVGELARVMARKYGDQSFKAGEKDNLCEEMADILWVLCCLANQTGVDLTEAFRQSMEKKTQRDAHRHLDNPKLKQKKMPDSNTQEINNGCTADNNN